MVLAEALVIRADLQQKISELENRLAINATIQEGETPPEDPIQLVKELERSLDELETLVYKINLSNATLMDEKKRTLTELLAKRDRLKQEILIKRYFLEQASRVSERARNTEILVKSSVDVAFFRKGLNKKSQELRELEILIQRLNWTSELVK